MIRIGMQLSMRTQASGDDTRKGKVDYINERHGWFKMIFTVPPSSFVKKGTSYSECYRLMDPEIKKYNKGVFYD